MRTASSLLRALAPLAALACWLVAPAAAAQPQPPATEAPPSPSAPPPEPTAPRPAATGDAEPAAAPGAAARREPPKDLAQRISTGLRVSMTRVRGSDADDHGFGLMFAGRGSSYQTLGSATHRETHLFAIGGGSAGFEGALEASLASGVRLPFDAQHGAFVRLGALGSLWGNKLLYSSILALPQVYLGYQYLHGSTVFEIAARGGAVLAGRYNPGDEASRKLGGSFEFGGHAALHAGPLGLEATLMRVNPDSLSGRPVDIARAVLCLWPGDLALCADGNLLRGDVGLGARGGTREARSEYVGLLVGWNLPDLGWKRARGRRAAE